MFVENNCCRRGQAVPGTNRITRETTTLHLTTTTSHITSNWEVDLSHHTHYILISSRSSTLHSADDWSTKIWIVICLNWPRTKVSSDCLITAELLSWLPPNSGHNGVNSPVVLSPPWRLCVLFANQQSVNVIQTRLDQSGSQQKKSKTFGRNCKQPGATEDKGKMN